MPTLNPAITLAGNLAGFNHDGLESISGALSI
jgi:hypothetical protein